MTKTKTKPKSNAKVKAKVTPVAKPKTNPKSKHKEPGVFYGLASRLKLVSDVNRLRIVLALGKAPLPLKQLRADVGAGASIPIQLALLKVSGLIETSRNGRGVIYSLTDKGREMEELIRGVIGIAY